MGFSASINLFRYYQYLQYLESIIPKFQFDPNERLGSIALGKCALRGKRLSALDLKKVLLGSVDLKSSRKLPNQT